jgi:hypothetical protein
MPKLLSVAIAAALAAAAALPVPAAHASHTCSLDEERDTLEQICESHPGNDISILDKLFCLISPSC